MEKVDESQSDNEFAGELTSDTVVLAPGAVIGRSQSTSSPAAIERRCSDELRGAVDLFAVSAWRTGREAIRSDPGRRLHLICAVTGELRLANLVSPPPDPPIVERIRSQLSRDLAWAARAPVEESTWARVRHDAGNVLTVLWRNGELLGARPEQAFYVKCDRTTMTQNDIDNGRLIIEVALPP